MSIAIKELLLSLGVMLLVTPQLCWAYRLPYPCPDEKKHHLPYRVDGPAKETYIKVLTPIPPPSPSPPSPPPLYDCNEDVYDNIADQYKEPRSGYLQKYVLYNEEQC
ncbi:hypothetical protein TSAR_001014 [Trichomalopsis sarcophagae]|uniref:Uncharacterized protein n=1 Tax=Trichomalopsis sarcophagae TaxID=543379 RepID=A0A232ENK2_9HYME|nr:hypothetical protein TSAR_001014 [Trichomalopsis sarcophagae]